MEQVSATHENVKQAVPFFMVSDMEQSLRFYLDGLGFELKNKWTPRGKIEWCWLTLGDAALMLQEYRKEIPSPPRGKPGEGISICFMCQDALIIYHDVIAKGIEVPEPFVGNNAWVVGITDPDGYRLFFESSTDVPEETTYTEWQKMRS